MCQLSECKKTCRDRYSKSKQKCSEVEKPQSTPNTLRWLVVLKCADSSIHLNVLCVCPFTGESRVHFSHHIHYGMFPEDRGVRASLSRRCLFTELLEYIRFCHCDNGVRHTHLHTHHSLNMDRNILHNYKHLLCDASQVVHCCGGLHQ